MAKKAIEIPGSAESSDIIANATEQVRIIENAAERIKDSQDINAQNEIVEILTQARQALDNIKKAEQRRATAVKKADMSAIKVHEQESRILNNRELTESGYVVD